MLASSLPKRDWTGKIEPVKTNTKCIGIKKGCTCPICRMINGVKTK